MNFLLETKKCQLKQKGSSTEKKLKSGKPPAEDKFKNYFDYKILVKHIKPHQVSTVKNYWLKYMLYAAKISGCERPSLQPSWDEVYI